MFISPHSPRNPVVAAGTKRNIRGTVRQNPGTPWMPHGDAANMLAWGLFVAKRLVFFIRRLKAAKVNSFFISSRKAVPLKACSHLPLKWQFVQFLHPKRTSTTLNSQWVYVNKLEVFGLFWVFFLKKRECFGRWLCLPALQRFIFR